MAEYWVALKAAYSVDMTADCWVNLMMADVTVLLMVSLLAVMTAQHAAAHWVASTGQWRAVCLVVN
jgi:hypothetical protein